ncbi:Protein sine oculis [Schistosoma japonicum]|nr:Protein sine oculis [Schistosoma japonicum]
MNYAEEINGFPFTISQVGCMCEVLISSHQIVSLRHLLNRIPKLWSMSENFVARHFQHQQLTKQSEMMTIDKLLESRESIIKALAIVAYEDENYAFVYKLLEYNHFSEMHQPVLQQLWYNTHYAEVQKSRDRPLTAVDKYRIRRKYPLPTTIWDGEETVYCFKQNVRRQLTEYYQRNKYPNSDEKYKLSIKTGLTITQISNWFKNHRQRDKSLESTDVHLQNGNNNYHCYQRLSKSNSTNSDSIKQHLLCIKNEFSNQAHRTYNNYQTINVQQKLSTNHCTYSTVPNYSTVNLKNLECNNKTSISHPIFLQDYLSFSHPDEIGFSQWTSDHFNIEQSHYEMNYLHNYCDYNQNHAYYTYDVINKGFNSVTDHMHLDDVHGESDTTDESIPSYLFISDQKVNFKLF